jgi:hypothetical protein
MYFAARTEGAHSNRAAFRSLPHLGAAWLISYCARPTRAFIGRALDEHKRLIRLPPSPFVLGCRACRR